MRIARGEAVGKVRDLRPEAIVGHDPQDGGLRYDYYAITGTTAPIAFPPAPGRDLDNAGGKWSPKMTLAAKPDRGPLWGSIRSRRGDAGMPRLNCVLY